MSDYILLLVGAVVGIVLVWIGHNYLDLQIEDWAAAIVTTVCAIVAVAIGPTDPRPVVGPDYIPAEAKQANTTTSVSGAV